MKIIGFNFTKILAEKKEQPKGKVNIKMNMDITGISKEKLMSLGQDVIKADFEFGIHYDKYAGFDFKGNMYFTSTPDKIKEVIKKWKTKKIPDDIRVVLFNFMLTKCNLKALQFEEEFNLPSHVPLPKVSTPKTGEANYVK